MLSTRRRTKSEPMPQWGRWSIGIVIALIIGCYLWLSGIAGRFFEALLGQFTISFPVITVLLLAGLYFIPSLIAARSPRLVAIAVANLIFGWTIFGWFIVLIWSLAEVGTANHKHKTSPPSLPRS